MSLLRDSLVPALLAAGLAATLVAGCGGGTSQVQNYQPNHLIALGEESSVLDDQAPTTAESGNGRKYSVNGVDTTGAVNCAQLPTVPQYVAARYGLVFKQCLNGYTGTPTAFAYARAGARVEDQINGLEAQIDAAEQDLGSLGPGDLLTVWIGVNDLIDLYRQLSLGRLSQDQALAEAQRRGARVAQIINERILAKGAHALVFTAPDMGLSPYARARLTSADPDPAYASVGPDDGATALLSELSTRYNGYLRVSIDPKRFDGRNFGLVFADEAVQAIHANPANFGAYLSSPYDIGTANCTVALTACTNAVDTSGNNTGGLAAGTSSTSNLWAGDRWLGYPGHYLLGSQAQSRLLSLPF